MRPVIILGPNVHVYDIQVTLQRVLGQCLGCQFGENGWEIMHKVNTLGPERASPFRDPMSDTLDVGSVCK